MKKNHTMTNKVSAENKKTDKIENLLRFIDLMVRQTCRRAHYDHYVRPKTNKEDKESIYSTDHLKKVYDKPREYVLQIVKNPQQTLKGLKVDNPMVLQKKECIFTKVEQKLLLDFVKKVQDQAPRSHFVWVDLQHHIFYAYRNYACRVPKPTSETLSAVFVCEMRELMNCLRRVDECQLWLRIFTLIREYCIFAQWHYSQNDQEEALRKFFSYYEAMLSAAKSLLPVFADFERDITYKNYHMCWIDFNTNIFVRYFYESDRVKGRIDEILRTQKSRGDTPQSIASLDKLLKTWHKHQSRMNHINRSGRFPDNTPEAIKDKRAVGAHKKLLSTTFWVDRTKEMKKLVDMSRMDHNIITLLNDRYFFPEGPGLNKNGQCICEECLIAKYKMYLDSEDFSIIADEDRTTYCRKCKCLLNLEKFQRHVNNHVEDPPTQKQQVTKPTNLTRIISEKMDFVKLGDSTVQLSEMLNEKLKISSDSLNNVDFSKTKKPDVATTKLAYEMFLQARKEGKGGAKTNGRTPSLREELMANGFGKAAKEDISAPSTPTITVTSAKLAETELMLREMGKNCHKPKMLNFNFPGYGETNRFPYPAPPYDLEQIKKCDCTYCEVFGPQKIIDPSDLNRVRFHRKREKKRIDNQEYNNQPFPDEESFRIRVESRVPLPPTPAFLPATPPELSDHSVASGSSLSDIQGIVNYIEGNPAKNKAELAQKKAAKKARQRERKLQEKVDAELEWQRKLEEQKRQEEDIQRQLKEEQERVELMKKTEENRLKKKLKKQRQAMKRQELAIQKNTIEETIPAMVTIKRVPGGENGAPSVTITLKGCTPDQDKLLTTLVEEPSVEISPEVKNKPASKVTGSKKKKSVPKPISEPIPHPQKLLKAPKILAKDVKVTLAVDKEPVTVVNGPMDVIVEKPFSRAKERAVKSTREPTEDEIKSLGNLRLPPGITITKVEGPVSNKTYLGSDRNDPASSVVGKSGVIVVDTEKLIQNPISDIASLKPPTKSSKKNKKKNSLAAQPTKESKDKPKMVTLRNPMFQPFQSQNLPKPSMAIDESAPAAIFTSENGMVTIRSSRLQQSLENGLGHPPLGAHLGLPLMPDLLSEVPNFPKPQQFPTPEKIVNGVDKLKIDVAENSINLKTMDAQEILSGLPGIEITKIDKRNEKKESVKVDNSCQTAHVSIIPSNGPEFDLEFDKDEDWLYENVFKPKDVLEDDMDDEELELEAFKRFCQQSVPPKEKKVAHINVSEIVVKKKLT